MAIENNLVGRGEKRNHAEMENDDDDEEVEEEEPIQPIQPSSKKKWYLLVNRMQSKLLQLVRQLVPT